jgi:putative proteasome-type protease
MTYCLGIATRFGLVMASDSRTNAGYDQVNVCQKMHTFVHPGERAFVLLTSGSLSCTQSVLTLLRRDFDAGRGLATAPTMYDGARIIGEQVRKVGELDRAALERDDYKFNVNIILGGQVKGEPHSLFLVYPQGNPLQATQDSPFLQIGETKYGRPILDRGIRYEHTTLEEAAKYALLSLDSTMKSNVTVGPPIDLLVYSAGELDVMRKRRFIENDPDLIKIRTRWQQALRQAVARLPNIKLTAKTADTPEAKDESIQLVDGGDSGGDLGAPQLSQRETQKSETRNQNQ